MHAKDGENIKFPYGVSLAKRGFGWYRLLPAKRNRSVDKINFAVTVLKRFLKEEEAKTDEELKRLVPLMLNPGMQVTSFSAGEFGYLGMPKLAEPAAPAAPNKLQMLVSKFSSNKGAK